MTYQPGIPTGTVDLNVDYQNLQTNFQALDTTFGVDHVTFSNVTPQNGYHEDIHFNPFSTTTTNAPNNYVASTQYPDPAGIPTPVPATVAGIGQLWSAEVNDSVTTDTGLFWISGNGLKTAMTRNFQPVVDGSLVAGATFLPGGIIMQWGVSTVPAAIGNGAVGLPKTFPNYLLSFQTTVISSTSTATDVILVAQGKTAGPVPSVLVRNPTATAKAFFWIALGY